MTFAPPLDVADRISTTRLDRYAAELVDLLGEENVLREDAALHAYGYDAFLIEARPGLVVFPRTTEEVQAIVRAARKHGVDYVARGAGTGYAGGALAVRGGVVVCLSRMRDPIELNEEERWAWVRPGVTTLEVQQAALRSGLRYPPDPSSYSTCTLGGNVATNAGGPHSLGYGITTDYVLELEVVDGTGHVRRLGGVSTRSYGLDFRGLFIGSEGILGIVTRIRLRLIRQPDHISTLIAEFDEIDAALSAIEQICATGCIPTALDMSTPFFIPGDREVRTLERAILYMDVEGSNAEVAAKLSAIKLIVEAFDGTADILPISELMDRRFRNTQQRMQQMIQLSGFRRYFLFDAVVPRLAMRRIFRVMRLLAQKHQLPVLNTFHAGDGNLHPMPFFDPLEPGVPERLMRFWSELLEEVARLGGALSGEHGIGVEKRDLMTRFYAPELLAIMGALKRGIEPSGLTNPDKLLPSSPPAAPVLRAAIAPEDPQAIHVSEVDGWISVPGGLTLDELRARLQSTAFDVPFDPISEPAGMTVEDAVLLGLPGARELRYGAARRLLLGGVLTSDGRAPIPFGSSFSKDVGGLDIRRLLWGSRGRLGRLQRVRLKLVPKSARSTFGRAVVGGLSVAAAAKRVRQIWNSRLDLSHLSLGRDAAGSLFIGYAFDGEVETVDEQLGAFARLCPDLAEVRIRTRAVNPPGRVWAPGPPDRIDIEDLLPWDLAYVADRLAGPFLSLAGANLTVFPSRASAPPPAWPHQDWTRHVQDAFLLGQ